MQILPLALSIPRGQPLMGLDRTLRLRFLRVVGDGKGGLFFLVRHPPRVLGKSAKHPPPSEDILREPICNVLLDALSHNPVVNFCNWVISPAFGLFQPSKFGLHKTSSNRKDRASPLAKVEVECVAVTDGMLCALAISDFPQKVKT